MPKDMPPPVPVAGAIVFPPARFVCSTIDVPDSSVVVLADGGTLTVLTRPMSRELAFVHLEGMNRHEAICRFCNGPQADGVCEDCGMAQ